MAGAPRSLNTSVYMFDPDFAIEGRHYAHPAISWGAAIAGAVIAVALGVLLTLLGVAIGATVFEADDLAGDRGALSIGGGLYLAFSQFVALQIGAFIAARTARYPDLHGGTFLGLLVWALALIMVAIAAGFGASLGSAALFMREPAMSREATAMLAWWGFCAFALGGAGAIAGGWLGAHHPAWEHRPRHSTPSARDLG